MPRLPRVHLEDVIYSVTLDGPQHEPVFRDHADYHKYLEILGKYKKEYQFKLFCYALLPNRLHLLLETNDQCPISQVMQKVTPHYTKYYNGKYNRKGHLFQKRFRSVIVEKELYGARLTRFLHLLPVQSGLVQDFREYLYTSYAAFAGHPGASDIDLSGEVQEILKDFPDSIMKENPYERFMLSADPNEVEFFTKKLSRGAFLGSDDFVSGVKEQMAKQLQNDAAPEIPATPPLAVTAGGVMTKRLWALSAALMLSVVASVHAVSLNLNAQAAIARANVMPSAVAAAGKAILNSRLVSVSHPVEQKSPAFVKASSGTSIRSAVPARFDLNGTTWEVELIPALESGEKTAIKDKIKFNGRSFESHYFKIRGFSNTNYTVTIQDNGIITWKTIQKNREGEMVSWRGDWHGDKMEGMLSYHSAGNSPRDFSFMSQGVTQ